MASQPAILQPKVNQTPNTNIDPDLLAYDQDILFASLRNTPGYFVFFYKLPIEVQRKIWKAAALYVPDPQIIKIDVFDAFFERIGGHQLLFYTHTKPSPLLTTCKKSRDEFIRNTKGKIVSEQRIIRFDNDKDTIFLNSNDEGLMDGHSQDSTFPIWELDWVLDFSTVKHIAIIDLDATIVARVYSNATAEISYDMDNPWFLSKFQSLETITHLSTDWNMIRDYGVPYMRSTLWSKFKGRITFATMEELSFIDKALDEGHRLPPGHFGSHFYPEQEFCEDFKMRYKPDWKIPELKYMVALVDGYESHKFDYRTVLSEEWVDVYSNDKDVQGLVVPPQKMGLENWMRNFRADEYVE